MPYNGSENRTMDNHKKIQEFIFRIRTREAQPLTVYLEPWADKFSVANDKALEFRVKGPIQESPSELIEIHVEPGIVTVYDNWPESEMQGRIVEAGGAENRSG
jgi:hypothetical protein